MVRGLDVFKKYFEAYPDNYVIIGGTACDMIIDEAGFVPRATKDIDIILVPHQSKLLCDWERVNLFQYISLPRSG